MAADNDHSLLLTISTSLARLESKVDGIKDRLDGIDRRLNDHESRLRVIEATDVVTVEAMTERDLEARKSRRWLVGIGITIGLGVVAEAITILIAVFN